MGTANETDAGVKTRSSLNQSPESLGSLFARHRRELTRKMHGKMRRISAAEWAFAAFPERRAPGTQSGVPGALLSGWFCVVGERVGEFRPPPLLASGLLGHYCTSSMRSSSVFRICMRTRCSWVPCTITATLRS